ncbi:MULTISPECIES: hypothetical protein [Gordonia]|uniref:Uncharacterized protein n=2 Tax=Gordonia TaxID=2053 RepID=L7LFE4_9ACTN|nr:MULTISPECIES: hypothetical protein [Gordonia]AUH69832.1 hypothetical protein CXX93_17885 [Gordonia sp. YC-JH1]KJR06271.1 membrane protein [Gordonia sihwensis]KXT56502.1 membrane protein [Gordonia sp. QH-12]MBY4571575.1 hypothetical protein [Gordonia sihwensis]WFN93571.1 hypothetical protein P5P27_03110 [Gordonia sihwensis]
MNRTANVVRMQLINKKIFVWLPLTIFGAAFAISLIIYGAIYASVSDLTDPIYGGASQAPLWYFAVIGIQAMSLTFPFSQAMSVTRREFYLGTTLTALLASIGLAVLYVIGGLIEKATDGWGIDGYFFAVPWIWNQGPAAAGLLYFMAPMLTFTIGFFAATVYKRFGMLTLVLIGIGLAAAIALAILGISLGGGWPAVGRWFTGLTPVAVGGYGLVLVAALSGVSYATLRRAIP